MRKIRIIICLLLAQTHILDAGETWPQWRGPTRDGYLQGEKLPASLADEKLSLSWEVKANQSYSGPIVDKRHVYITETRSRSTEVVRALDRSTGEEIWQVEWEGAMNVPFFAKANGDWIRATPATDGEWLYVAGMRDVLVCLDCQTGAQIWRYDFPAKDGTNLPTFGCVSSPLIFQDSVYVQAGGGFCRINKQTGKLIWKVLNDGGGMSGSAFSSPFLFQKDGNSQILVQTRTELAAIDPEGGEVLWKQAVEAYRGMNILTPVVYQDSVLTSSYGGGTLLLNLPTSQSEGELKQIWKHKVEGYMSTPVIIGDYAYHHLKNQRATCIDLKTGESAWTTKPFGKYWSLITDGDKILALDEKGQLILFNATPEKFDLLDQRKISESPAWAHVAFSSGQLFVRDLEWLKVYDWK